MKTVKGHAPRRRFGQNFLVDNGIIQQIVSLIHPQSGDKLVEIGPGLGALTRPLLQQSGSLDVVEIDRDLITRLRQSPLASQLAIHEGDALAFDFGGLAEPGKKLRLVGNLPYNISTPLLFHLATYADQIHDMHFMLQKEVVERMVAEPGSSAFGRLSVMLQYRFVMDSLLDVPPESFDPAPQVESAIVRLIPRPRSELLARDLECLSQLVQAAFSQRRKMIRNTLRGLLNESELVSLGLLPTVRAEDIPVSGFVQMANLLSARR